MGILTHERILMLQAAAVSARLTEHRGALLAGIHSDLVASLPLASSPSAQVLSDLDTLNQVESLVDGSVPLAIWLQNSIALAGKLSESTILATALTKWFPTFRIPRSQTNSVSNAARTPVLAEARSVIQSLAAVDLTAEALMGTLTWPIGLEKTTRTLQRKLALAERHHVLLLGPPGVGKSALIRSLALTLAQSGGGPRVYSSSATTHGRDLLIVPPLADGPEPSTILCIQHIDKLLLGDSRIRSLLSSAFANPTLRIIGTATVEDGGLSDEPWIRDHFSTLMVSEPDSNLTLQIVQGAAASLERHHGIFFTPAAVALAIQLSKQFMPDECLPGKALRLLDEASTFAKFPSTGMKRGSKLASHVDGEVVRYAAARMLGIRLEDLPINQQ